MKKKFLTFAVTGLLVFSAGHVMSQPPPPPPPPSSTSGPIDNGSVALLLGVTCFGYLQLRKKATL